MEVPSSEAQHEWADGQKTSESSGQPDALAIQQLLSSGIIPNPINPGEVMYVVVGDVTYEIVGPTKPGGEVTINPVPAGIQIEDLANLNNEQDAVKSESYQIQAGEQIADNSNIQQMTQGSDGVQLVMMEDGSMKQNEAHTIKLKGQDFVLQPGQQLPLEIQEMISKGLPVDLSNYEFVIEGEQQQQPQQSQQQQQQNYLMTENFQNLHNSNLGGDLSNNDLQSKPGIYIQVITASPGEYDDGEFSSLAPTGEEKMIHNQPPTNIPNTNFMNAYLSFVKAGGPKGEQLKNRYQNSFRNESLKSPSSSGRSLLLSNQFNKQVKRKRLNESDGDEDKEDDPDDPTWKMEPRFKQRPKQRTPFSSPPIRSSPNLMQHDLSRFHSPTSDYHIEFPVQYIMQNEPHNFFKGDFVVDKKDAYKSEFPIWRIENGKLLQKFDSFIDSGRLFHKSASVYSSWSGDIRTNFKAVMVDIISTSSAPIGRKQDIVVKVHDKFIPKPADESLEQNALMQFFNIYVHVLLNQVFESAYLNAIKQQNVEYYLEPMTQIDQLISEAKQAAVSEHLWNQEFKEILEMYTCYTIVNLKPNDSIKPHCQAIKDGGVAVKIVKFYGQSYNREKLVSKNELNLASAQEIYIGKTALNNLGVYHALHHFKYLLLRKCHEEAAFQVASLNKTGADVPDICIQNRIWVQQMFQDLKGLLDRYIIIKTEEDNSDENQENIDNNNNNNNNNNNINNNNNNNNNDDNITNVSEAQPSATDGNATSVQESTG